MGPGPHEFQAIIMGDGSNSLVCLCVSFVFMKV